MIDKMKRNPVGGDAPRSFLTVGFFVDGATAGGDGGGGGGLSWSHD